MDDPALSDLDVAVLHSAESPQTTRERDDRFPSDADLAAELGLLRRERDRAGALR